MAVFYGNWNQTNWSTVFYFINCIRGDISPNLILCHANVELSAALAHWFKNCDSCCYCLCTCLNDKWCTLPCSAVNFLDEASFSSLFLCFIVLSRINSLEIHWFLRCTELYSYIDYCNIPVMLFVLSWRKMEHDTVKLKFSSSELAYYLPS